VLLTFSVCVALSVYLAHAARIRPAVRLLVAAAVLVLLFLCIKGVEYRTEYSEGLLPLFSRPVRFLSSAAKLFMDLFLISPALHAVHVTIGIVQAMDARSC